MAKQINCGFCAINGETIAMVLINNTFFRCPECKGESHPDANGDDSFIKYWLKQQQYRSCSLPEGVHVHGGGDSTGKSKKNAMKKPSLSKLNFNLYK